MLNAVEHRLSFAFLYPGKLIEFVTSAPISSPSAYSVFFPSKCSSSALHPLW
jgi:hypothetical protein